MCIEIWVYVCVPTKITSSFVSNTILLLYWHALSCPKSRPTLHSRGKPFRARGWRQLWTTICSDWSVNVTCRVLLLLCPEVWPCSSFGFLRTFAFLTFFETSGISDVSSINEADRQYQRVSDVDFCFLTYNWIRFCK